MAFADYIADEWLAGQDSWVREIIDVEISLRDERSTPLRLAVPEQLAPGVRLRISGLDFPDYARRTTDGRLHLPWQLMFETIRPRARPVALLALPTGRLLIVRDEGAREIAGLVRCPGGGPVPGVGRTDWPVWPTEASPGLLGRLERAGAVGRAGTGL